MKLTGELKDKVDQAATLEDAKDIIAQAGQKLTDDEVGEATGGVTLPQNQENDQASQIDFSNPFSKPGLTISDLIQKQTSSLRNGWPDYDEHEDKTPVIHGPIGKERGL